MGLFNKLFKSDCEGLIEAYLQTYKQIKNSPQFQAEATLFEEDTKMPREFHYANTTVKARRYNQYQIEVPEDIRIRAAQAVERMIQIG